MNPTDDLAVPEFDEDGDDDRTPVYHLSFEELQDALRRQIDGTEAIRTSAAHLAKDRSDARDLLEEILPVLDALALSDLVERIRLYLDRTASP